MKNKLSNELIKSLDILGYENLTEIQELTLDKIFKEKDIIIKSKTGSGKTAAFSIPLIEQIDWNISEPQALIIVPTRELAIQVCEEISSLAKFKRQNWIACYGKSNIDNQRKQLRQKVHGIVATPGRLIDLFEREYLNIDNIKTIVIDEFDELLDMGFIDDVEYILDEIEYKQLICCSATLNEEVLDVLDDLDLNFEIVEASESKLDLDVYKVLEVDRVIEKIISNFKANSILIFVETKIDCEEVYNSLKKYRIPITLLHGDLKQKDREFNIRQFKKNKMKILVATNIAARGIDIGDLELVINYNIPNNIEQLEHRNGRTARANKKGIIVNVYNDNKILDQYSDTKGITINDLELKDKFDLTYLNEDKSIKQLKEEIIGNNISTIFINAGKNKKIRASDIVGAIMGSGLVTFENIGIIEVKDNSTNVELLNKGDLVLDYLKNNNIKGKIRRVEIKYKKN